MTATIGLTTVDGTAMHSRCWYIPPELTGPLAEHLTAMFGVPVEMVSNAASMQAGAQRAAADGDTVFLLPADGGGRE